MLKAFILVAFSLLSAAFALPTDDALGHAGYTELDAIPAFDGLNDLEARTHQGTISSADLLASCPGGPGSPNVARADRCTLVDIVNNPDKRIWSTLGQPQLNCHGGVTPVNETLGGTTEVHQKITVTVELGFDIGIIKFGASVATEFGTSTTQSKTIMFGVLPGKQAVYLVGVNHKSRTGRIQVNYGSRQKGHYIWYTGARLTQVAPDPNDVEFDVYVSDCGANPYDLSKFNS